MTEAKLYLFPTPISDISPMDSMPSINFDLLNSCECFIVEELRSARRFLKKAGYKKDLNSIEFFLLNEHTNLNEIESYLDPIKEGKNIGLMSEAGLPCIADPGSSIVALAQREKISICPLIGPSSILLALMSSGFNGQNFAFLGYLPAEKSLREKKIREIESFMYKNNQTQIFIEAPYRNSNLLESLLKSLQNHSLLCIGLDIMGSQEKIITMSVKDWKKEKIDINKKNAVFLIYKP